MTEQAPTLDVAKVPGIPFPRLVWVELRKMADTRAGAWLLGAIVVITVLAVGLWLVFAPDEVQDFESYLGATVTPQGLLLPVLGVLLVTGEWGQRAALTTFTLVPSRARILAAKVIAAVLFGLAAIAIALVIASLASLLAGVDDVWGSYGFGDLGAAGLLQTLGILQGLAFGMLLLNSAAAIVTFFVLPIAFSIVTSLVEWFGDAQPWIDPGTAQLPLLSGEALTGEEWAQVLTTTLLWVAAPMAIGAWRILRAEVK